MTDAQSMPVRVEVTPLYGTRNGQLQVFFGPDMQVYVNLDVQQMDELAKTIQHVKKMILSQ